MPSSPPSLAAPAPLFPGPLSGALASTTTLLLAHPSIITVGRLFLSNDGMDPEVKIIERRARNEQEEKQDLVEIQSATKIGGRRQGFQALKHLARHSHRRRRHRCRLA